MEMGSLSLKSSEYPPRTAVTAPVPKTPWQDVRSSLRRPGIEHQSVPDARLLLYLAYALGKVG